MSVRSPLYPYQAEAVEKGVQQGGRTAILAPPGSGKTRIAIEILNRLETFRVAEIHPARILVLGSNVATATWVKQFPQWADIDPHRIHVVTGTLHNRYAILNKQGEYAEGYLDCDVFIANYMVAHRDRDALYAFHWDAIICDEYHKTLLRHKRGRKKKVLKDGSKPVSVWEVVMKLAKQVDQMIWISGSFLRRDPSSMWTMFHMIDHERWSSYWRWVNTYCLTEQNAYTRHAIIGPKNVKELRGLLDEHCIRIMEETVADQLPEGNRSRQYVELTPVQKRLYGEIRDDMIAELDSGDYAITPHAATQLVMLRQILCSPRLVDPGCKELGGGLDYIIDQIDATDEETWHFAVMVPFRDACDIVAGALKEAMPKRFDGDVEILRGGLDHQEVQRIVNNFRAFKGPIVGTIAFAESYNLETCKRTYFLGYDYILDANQQAEGRTRRAISKHKLVNWHYLCYAGTVDEYMLSKLNTDQMNVNKVLRTPQGLRTALNQGE